MRYLNPRPKARTTAPSAEQRLRTTESRLAEERLDRHRAIAALHTRWMR